MTEGAEKTGMAAEQLRVSSGELSRQAEVLNSRVGRFLADIRTA
ncbi:hypothetical protein [Roseomonas sp. WA12]